MTAYAPYLMMFLLGMAVMGFVEQLVTALARRKALKDLEC